MRRSIVLVMMTLTAVACSSGDVTSSGDGGSSDGAVTGDDASARGDASGSGCHIDLDCRVDGGGGGSCSRVEDPVCGGPAPPNECMSDSDCADSGVDFICEETACGGHACIPKCKMDAECTSKFPSLACNAMGRCRAKPCTTTPDCPTNFICSVDKECNPKPCLDDSVCASFCVVGACSSSPGVCRLPVP